MMERLYRMRSDSIGDVRAKSKAFLSFTYIKFKLKILSLVTHKERVFAAKGSATLCVSYKL